MIKRALLSVSDKTGLADFAKALSAAGVDLIASGGTAAYLEAEGLAVTSVEAFAGIPASLDGRVKTLHPKIYMGILARRDDAAHMQSVGDAGVIDMVVVNLYPFEQTVAEPGTELDAAIEKIDVGGVCLLRAAAKNFHHVAVVSDPSQYAAVAEALQDGALGAELRRALAVAAFSQTTAYDQAIAGYLREDAGFPDRRPLNVSPKQGLRYGENPHQKGAWFDAGGPRWGLHTLAQLQGKELSYNNLLDIDAAFRALLEVDETAAVVVKHASQCGLALGGSAEEAYRRAWECDAESAFGGVVGFNRNVDAAAAKRLVETFLEVVLAPGFDAEALQILQAKKNLRAVTIAWPEAVPQSAEWRQLSGAWIVQERDSKRVAKSEMRVVTKVQPSEAQWQDLLFAWASVKTVKSNGIVLAKNKATVGIGQGQPSRVGAARIAVEKAGRKARGAVVASDAFFPFADSIEHLAQYGIVAIIQPGGSVRDAEVIAAADHLGLPMVLTGTRHFRH